MEFFKPGVVYDFMKYRRYFVGVSIFNCVAAIVLLVYPGLNYGIDFRGGTELQLHFNGAMDTARLRGIVDELGYEGADVLDVADRENAFIIRVGEVSRIAEGTDLAVRNALDERFEVEVADVEISPGGDKVSLRFGDDVDMETVAEVLRAQNLELRGEVHRFGPAADHRYEVDLVGIADRIVAQLRERLGEDGPADPDRVEWVGPRAGAQLREAATRSLLYTIALIMVYVAFRFDLRFAPGGVAALVHDALAVVLFYILSRREFNLTTVAALLTVVGYSINDTIVVYDRVRENMARFRDKSLSELINISTSETLGRTLITGGTTMISMLPFFVLGTQTIKDISFALEVGFLVGTYSSIYIAAPITEYMDTRFFAKAREERLAALARARAAKKKSGGLAPATR